MIRRDIWRVFAVACGVIVWRRLTPVHVDVPQSGTFYLGDVVEFCWRRADEFWSEPMEATA